MDPKDVHALRPGLTELDPVTLAVIQNGLQQVCNEMDLAFVRAAFSLVISEALDRSDGIYHRDSGERGRRRRGDGLGPMPAGLETRPRRPISAGRSKSEEGGGT